MFTFIVLPLSFLHFSLSFSYHTIKNHINSLEALASYAPTCFESRHLWQESRSDALSILHLKFLYFMPSYLLSLIAATTTVNSSYSTLTWKRLLVTTICIYVMSLSYSQLFFVSVIVMGNNSLLTKPSLFVWAFELVLLDYLMAVLDNGN
ncbi:hypothetical protein CICLE_v10006798mg [Citrus x clementina]|uniref:DUF4220 domain-containing protein n=1 Tax=Citrus clementina TaxID=85681 RepID=V4S8L8_CITCL|nr:hypothetical protein CICLE_v10006798mg [Citrus x clementina]